MEDDGPKVQPLDEKTVFATLMCFPARIKQCMDAVVASYMPDSRIRMPHLMTVAVIGSLDSPSQKEVREHLPFDKSYISIIVRELIEQGYVVNKGEGKIQSLKLTENGRNLEAVSRMIRDIIGANLFRDLDDDERMVFETCLGKLEGRIDTIMQSYSSKDARQ